MLIYDKLAQYFIYISSVEDRLITNLRVYYSYVFVLCSLFQHKKLRQLNWTTDTLF